MQSYQVVADNGSRYEAVEIAVLQLWAREGRITPETVLRDPVRGLEFKAGEVPDLQGSFISMVRQEVLPPEAWAPQSRRSALASMAMGLASASFCTALVGLIPCLGWMQWFTLALGGLSHLFSWIAFLSNRFPGERGTALVAMILSAFVVVLGSARLVIGGGCL